MPKMSKYDNLIELLIFDPLYEIREDGTIWAYKPKTGPIVEGKIYPLRRVDRLGPDGKCKVVAYREPNQSIHVIKQLFAHRIIYRKFIGILDPVLEINHKDGNRSNNLPSNLEQISCIDNIKHAVVNHLVSHGEMRPGSKLTQHDVINIRNLLNQGVGVCELGRMFGVNHQVISKIKSNEAWKHIT